MITEKKNNQLTEVFSKLTEYEKESKDPYLTEVVKKLKADVNKLISSSAIESAQGDSKP